jgi:cell division protein FtsL
MPEDMSDRMPEDLPVTKRINVMVGITRSKVIFVAFVVLFIFAALVVCAAGAVLHVVVAALLIKQNNKEARGTTKAPKAEKTTTKQRTPNKQTKT